MLMPLTSSGREFLGMSILNTPLTELMFFEMLAPSQAKRNKSVVFQIFFIFGIGHDILQYIFYLSSGAVNL